MMRILFLTYCLPYPLDRSERLRTYHLGQEQKATLMRLRELTGIAEYENIIMLATAGHMPEEFKVAKSKRRRFIR